MDLRHGSKHGEPTGPCQSNGQPIRPRPQHSSHSGEQADATEQCRPRLYYFTLKQSECGAAGTGGLIIAL